MFDPPPHPLAPEVALPSLTLQSLLNTTGVKEFVICAGARNSALLVLLAAVPGLRLWHHFEERSAAFFALGRILDHQQPVAVVTTSGTAVAELLPAIIEAHYQGLPLIALTADRPPHFRGSGAPQAIEQVGIFGNYPSMTLDVIDLETAPDTLAPLENWKPHGPLHLNICLQEPSAATLLHLRNAGANLQLAESPPHFLPANSHDHATYNETLYPNPLLLAGDLLPSEICAVAAFALSLQAPFYAEAASGLREHPALRHLLISGGDLALSQVPHQSVIRLGGVPSCRFWRDLENRPEIPVLSYSRSGHPGLARHSQIQSLRKISDSRQRKKNEQLGGIADPPPTVRPFVPPNPWLLPTALADSLSTYPTSEPALIHALSRLIPAQSVLFTGNSLAIRQWNLCALPSHPLHARALRGANGIDGNLSAFFGLAADAEEAWCLVGDLTALYDLAAPWILSQLQTPRLRLVVIQNAGGKIFSRLPALHGLTDFERQLMENPHQISLSGWAQQWGLAHRSYQNQLPQNTLLPNRVVIELYPDPLATEAFWLGWAKNTPALPLSPHPP